MNYALAFIAYLSIPVYVATTLIPPVPEAQAETTEQPAEEEPPIQEPEAPATTEDLLREYFPEHYDQAVKIATCESGLNPEAVGDKKIAYYRNGVKYGESYGLFQIRYLPGRLTPDELKDPETNIKYARSLFDASKQTWGKHWKHCARKAGLR